MPPRNTAPKPKSERTPRSSEPRVAGVAGSVETVAVGTEGEAHSLARRLLGMLGDGVTPRLQVNGKVSFMLALKSLTHMSGLRKQAGVARVTAFCPTVRKGGMKAMLTLGLKEENALLFVSEVEAARVASDDGGKEQQILRVSARTAPGMLSKALEKSLLDPSAREEEGAVPAVGARAIVSCVGAGAADVAVRTLTNVRSFLVVRGRDLLIVPSVTLEEVEVGIIEVVTLHVIVTDARPRQATPAASSSGSSRSSDGAVAGTSTQERRERSASASSANSAGSAGGGGGVESTGTPTMTVTVREWQALNKQVEVLVRLNEHLTQIISARLDDC